MATLAVVGFFESECDRDVARVGLGCERLAIVTLEFSLLLSPGRLHTSSGSLGDCTRTDALVALSQTLTYSSP